VPALPTEPSGDQPGLPIRTLRASVVDGPDAGRSKNADDESLTIGTAETNGLVLSDSTVSRFHAELVHAGKGVLVIDHGSTNGTVYEGARIERAIVPDGSVLQLGRSRIAVGDGERVTVELHDDQEYSGLYGRTPVMRRLMARVRRAAQADVSVLLVGESGTGKELIARALHDSGTRQGKPFVTVDCGALAPSLVASELFGHEKGAFTGADRQRFGALEQAHGGTLFLDEIGELAPALQPTLLGALERRRFRRVGGREEIDVDVRLVCATHRDLRSEVNRGAFRLDLYYRIAVVILVAPTLRDHMEDIPVLVEHFLRDLGEEGVVESVVSHDVMAALCSHHWPGNVRELRNVVEALVTMGEPPILDAAAPGESSADIVSRVFPLRYRQARATVLRDFESRYLKHLLSRTEGNVARAAREAGMDRSYLIRLLQSHAMAKKST